MAEKRTVPGVGRELDEAVAERVFGGTPYVVVHGYRTYGSLMFTPLSTDDGLALRYVWPKIVERVSHAVAIVFDGEVYSVQVGGFEQSSLFCADAAMAHAPTLAEAICRFALALYETPNEETT